MYLILSPSPYSERDTMNYKSLDSYQNFVKGCVRRVLVRPVGNKRILIGRLVGVLFFKNSAIDKIFFE